MFRKTFICAAGIIAGVSAGAYSSGFFNEGNVVTTMYNQAIESMGLETQDGASMSDGMIKDGMAGKSHVESFISAGASSSGTGIDNQSITDSIGETDPLFDDAYDSDNTSLAQEPLESSGISRAPKIKRLDEKDVAAAIENRNDEEAVARLAKEAEAAFKEAALKKAEFERRQADLERQMAEEKKLREEQARIKAKQARIEAEQARIEAEQARIKAEWERAQVLVETRFSKEVYESSTGEKLNYRKLVPKKSSKAKLVPLVLFLHGKGERGDDNQTQLKHGLKLFAADEGMKRFPAIVIAPQCPADDFWATTVEQKDTTPEMDLQPTPSMRLVIELLDSMLLNESVDPDRVYVTGLSMGGFGTFDLIARRPTLFAAAAPLCGGGDPSLSKIRRILRMPMWVVHGTEDETVNINRSREMVYALESAGASPRYSELSGFGHNIWDATYGDIELYNWMFRQSKRKPASLRPRKSQARKPRSTGAAAAKPTLASRKPAVRQPASVVSRKPTPQVKRPSAATANAEDLLGEWKVLAASQKGKQASKKALDKMSVTFESDQFVIQMDGRQEIAKFKLSNSENTQQINILSNREGVEESAGIYELSGDKLIICWGEPGRPRPKRFVNFMNVKSLVLERP